LMVGISLEFGCWNLALFLGSFDENFRASIAEMCGILMSSH
jgi:hypothetical protein